MAQIVKENEISRGMRAAFLLACEAKKLNEVPVGAVILDEKGNEIAWAHNEMQAQQDAAAHAEMLVMRRAAIQRGSKLLSDCTLVVTLEPCPMCAAAMVHYRIKRLIFGAYDVKGGGVDHGARIFDHPSCVHRPEIIGGVRASENGALMQKFFRERRK